MLTALLSRLVILVFGTMLPAFSSYKAIRTKNMRAYVQWMMYWIVFALFCVVETFTDLLLSWLPFYYEVKMLLVFWLLSPATHGSSLLYTQFVHPWLVRNELEIERCLERARQQGYAAVVQLGSRGMSYATQVLIQTAMAGGSGLAQHVQRSYSVNDVTDMATTESLQWRHLPAATATTTGTQQTLHDLDSADAAAAAAAAAAGALETEESLSLRQSRAGTTSRRRQRQRQERDSPDDDGNVDEEEMSWPGARASSGRRQQHQQQQPRRRRVQCEDSADQELSGTHSGRRVSTRRH